MLLERHVELEIDPDSGWPVLRVRLRDDGRCPFVETTGCGVYEHRPTCCRTYPLIRAVREGGRASAIEEVFLREATTSCLGWAEPRSLTVSEWVEERAATGINATDDVPLHKN